MKRFLTLANMLRAIRVGILGFVIIGFTICCFHPIGWIKATNAFIICTSAIVLIRYNGKCPITLLEYKLRHPEKVHYIDCKDFLWCIFYTLGIEKFHPNLIITFLTISAFTVAIVVQATL